MLSEMATISAYRRPVSLAQVWEILDHLDAVAMAGGTKVNATPAGSPIEVVDLQALHLDAIESIDGRLVIGATATLQQVAESGAVPSVVREAARREQPSTVRSQATIGGCVATGDFESELLATLLVHDATVRTARRAGVEEMPLEVLLADLPVPSGAIITAVSLDPRGVSAVARTGRTGADRAIVAAVARVVDGEQRLALTGVAATPILMHGPDGIHPPPDFRGSSVYRRSLAATLSGRVLAAIA